MALNIPTRAQLQTQIAADMAARIPGADTSLRRSTIRILAYVWAASLWLVYRFIVNLSAQLFVSSATGSYLDLRVGEDGIVREGATFAAGNVIITGSADIPIPINTLFQTTDGSVQFATQAAVSIGAGSTVSVAIVATVAGSAGNLPAGATLNLWVAIPGVQPSGAVDGAGTTGGTDIETDASLRTRGLARRQQPPQGGCATDYVAWAKLVPGVSRVWVYPLNRGLGTVDILFVMDGRASNIPLTADIAAVQASIDTYRPATASSSLAAAPAADALTIRVLNLLPNTPAMQAAVSASLQALRLTVPAGAAVVGDGVSAANPGGTLLLEQIYGAISAAGPAGFDLAAPAADVTLALGHVPGVWTITWA